MSESVKINLDVDTGQAEERLRRIGREAERGSTSESTSGGEEYSRNTERLTEAINRLAGEMNQSRTRGGPGGNGGGGSQGGNGSNGGGGGWAGGNYYRDPKSRFVGLVGSAAGAMATGAGDGGFFGSAGSMAGIGIGAAMGGPVGALVGGLASGVLGGLGGGLDRAMESAFEEAVNVSRLRTSIGGVGVEFDDLRDNIRLAADGMGIAYTESTRLAKEFTKVAMLSGEQAKNELQPELRNAYGFSRGFGIEPKEGVQFFSQMRHLGVTDDDKSSKRMGFAVADAIGKSGMFARSDEFLSAISSLSQSAAKSGFMAPDAHGYASLLSELTGLKRPGLDVNAALSMTGQVESALQHGGQHGEASQNLSYFAYNRALGGSFNAMHQGILDAAPMTAKTKDIFGEGSAYWKNATPQERKEIEGYAKSPGWNQSKLDMQMKEIMHQTEGRPSYERYAMMQQHFGMNQAQANAWMESWQKRQETDPDGTKLEKFIAGTGINPDNIKSSVSADMGSIAYGDEKTLRGYVKTLRDGKSLTRLSDKESASLSAAEEKAKKGDMEALRTELGKLMAVRDRPMTEGDKAQKTREDLQNTLQTFAGAMIPLTTTMKDGIVDLAMIMAPDGKVATAAKAEQELIKNARGESSLADRALDRALDSALPVGVGVAMQFYRQYRQAKANQAIEEQRKNPNYMPVTEDMRLEQNKRNLADTEKKADEERKQYEADRKTEQDRQASISRVGNIPRQPSISGDKIARNTADKVMAPSKYDDLFKDAAQKHGVDWRDVKQIAVQESGLKPNAMNVNKNGTMDRGIMQLNSRYDGERGVKDPWDAKENIFAGTKVWADNLKKSGGDKKAAMRAYNGTGPAADAYANRAMAVNELVHSLPELPRPPVKTANKSTPPAAPKWEPIWNEQRPLVSNGMVPATHVSSSAGADVKTTSGPQKIELEIKLLNPNGTAAAAPVSTQATVYKHGSVPRPTGGKV